MNLISQALQLFKKNPKRRWFGHCPDIKLEKKLNQILPETIDDQSDFFQLDYNLLKNLIKNDLINTKYRLAYNSIIYSGVCAQRVEDVTHSDLEMVYKSVTGDTLKEVMQLKIITKDRQSVCSELIDGKENFISSIGEIYEWFSKQLSILNSSGKKAAKLEINHVHPSIEVLIVAQEKTTTITNGLSERDVRTAKLIRERLNLPLKISAIIPSGLKYSAVL